MAFLPSALRFRRSPRSSTTGGRFSSDLSSSEKISPRKNATSHRRQVSRADIRRSTKLRMSFAAVASVSYLVSFVFLVLILVGSTSNRTVLRDVYFFKLDLSNIIPLSAPNAMLINSIARTLGLHDFYQVGLWNFCEGYNGEGITFCSTPQTLYWFNPVEVLTNELLAGATIALPTQIITVLNILRLASQIMFGFFLTACVLTFLLVLLSPLVLWSRWYSLPFALISLVDAILIVAASVIGTVISWVFKYAAESQSALNIRAAVGTRMMVFVWIASGFALLAFVIHAGLGCCCASKRDIATGRRPVRGDSARTAKSARETTATTVGTEREDGSQETGTGTAAAHETRGVYA
ncbi:SUR7/PalI family-domain-containing protein [Coniochaeta sp. 2T2.1]|nr:SUR7/PalI family-domain-containing protein [Coniochaeta sp. 2T2.1]